MKQTAFYLKPRAELGGSYMDGRPLCSFTDQDDCLNTPVYAKWRGEGKYNGRYYMGWISKVFENGDYSIRWRDRDGEQRTSSDEVKSFY